MRPVKPLFGLHSPLKPGINFAKRRLVVGVHALKVSARLLFAAVPMFFNEVREHLGADTFAQSAAKTQQRTLTQWAIFSGAHSGGRRM